MKISKYKLDAIFSGLSILWIPKTNFQIIPIICILYFLIRIYFLKKVNINYIRIPTLMLISSILLMIYYYISAPIDLIRQFSRFVLPNFFIFLNLTLFSEYKAKDLEKYLKVFFITINVLALIDFSYFIFFPQYLLTAPLNPYKYKAFTSLFNDSNWTGYFLIFVEILSIMAGKIESKLSSLFRGLLIYISASRTAFVIYLGIIFYRILTELKFYKKSFNFYNLNLIFKPIKRLTLSKRIISLIILFLFLTLPIIYFLITSGIILENPTKDVSLSANDGSLKTKFFIIDYALNAINNLKVLLLGNGPGIVLDKVPYSGHSIIGLIPEFGILGISISLMPFLIFVNRFATKYLFYISLIIFSSSISFFPIAYIYPFTSILLLFSLPKNKKFFNKFL